MSRLEKAILSLNQVESIENIGLLQRIDPRCKIVVTLLFLIAVLSVPLTSFDRLLWFFAVPIVLSTMAAISYGSVFKTSLIVLPFIALIGIFNPFIDKIPVEIGYGIIIRKGWITFGSIILRGLLSMQAVLILLRSTGFIPMCDGLRRLGVGRIITTQLMMVYRYVGVLMNEALTMKRARLSRGYGKDNFSLKVWGQMIGQLLLRTVDRAGRIHNAMLSRGFDGSVTVMSHIKWHPRDTFFLIGSLGVFAFLYFVNISSFFS